MKYFRNKKSIFITVIGTILLLPLLLIIGLKLLPHDPPILDHVSNNTEVIAEKKYTSEEEIKEAQKLRGIPFERGSVDSTNLDYYWLNETVVDGSFDCYVFNKYTFQIYGSAYTTAGFGSPSISGRAYYQNQDHDINFIEQTLDSVCDFSTQ
jgi:hypothetical protein